jgi:DNA excision repair protein ERCC-4
MKIVIDSREQLPYEFTTPTRTATLPTGDYSISGAENLIAIERKTADDLVVSITRDRERFERELHRGMALQYFAVVAETSYSDLAGGRYRSNMNPKAAVQSLLTFSVRYRVPVFFAGSRENGAEITESLLQKFAREMEKRLNAMNAARDSRIGKTKRRFNNGNINRDFKQRWFEDNRIESKDSDP